jgi:hypothetical protein
VTAEVPPEAPAKPGKNLRGAVLWTAGILLALALAWFVGAVAVPFFQVRAIVREFGGIPSNVAAPYIKRLGGPERAGARLALFVRLPGWATSSRDRYYAARLIACTSQWKLACEVYRTTRYTEVKEALFSEVFSPPLVKGLVTREYVTNQYGQPDRVSQNGTRWEYDGIGEHCLLDFNGDGKLKNIEFFVTGR